MIGFGALGSALAVMVLSLGIYVLSVAAQAPPISSLKPIDQGTSSRVFAADGSLLGYIQHDQVRTPVPLSRIPRELQQATIAIEDERFYKHGGVDFEGILRAAVKDIEAGRAVQGGSTITMQLVRNLYISEPKRDLARKIKEAKLAEELEKEHSKDWILNSYLNSASYGTLDGRTAVGVEAAAQTHFNRPARRLTLEQSALLAGLPQSPSRYNPFLNPTGALERRNRVLQAMEREGYISPEQADAGYRKPLGLSRGYRYTRIREPYFFDYVQQQLIERYGVNVVRKGGLTIQSTIDPDLQEAGRDAIDSNLGQPGDPSAAVVSIDPATGYVRAMASSGTYRRAQFNLAAQGHRQPGSAAKVWVLTTAIRRGVNPNTTYYTSKPLSLQLPGFGYWKVSTYSESYIGSVNLVKATLASDNTVYAQLDLDLGPQAVAQTAKLMGIETELDGLPAEGLGGLRLGVSPLEMSNAYATLASGGIRNKPIAIQTVRFPDGRTDEIGSPQRKRVFSDGVAYEVTKILQQNIQSGTGTRANIGCPAAGKTGTTDNFNDAWFVGYTAPSARGRSEDGGHEPGEQLATSAWVGYPDALRSMSSVHGISVAGGTFPAAIWGDYMRVATGGVCGSFPPPREPVEWIPFYGRYANQGPPEGSSDTGDTSAGGDNYSGGYDPRAYAPGIQNGGGGGGEGGGGGGNP